MTRPEGTLTDAGPLFALVNPRGEPANFGRCRAAVIGPNTLPFPLVTTTPCLTEAAYLAGEAGRWPMQSLLRDMMIDGRLQVADMGRDEWTRIWVLMETYQDTPMDLADASLIALAEVRGDRKIFSIDSDFYVYRLADGSALEVVPGPLPKSAKSR